MNYFDSPEFQEIAEDYELYALTGLDDACIGITAHPLQPQLVYSAAMIINILMADDGMDPDEALEWFLHNTVGGLPNTPTAPVILQDF